MGARHLEVVNPAGVKGHRVVAFPFVGFCAKQMWIDDRDNRGHLLGAVEVEHDQHHRNCQDQQSEQSREAEQVVETDEEGDGCDLDAQEGRYEGDAATQITEATEAALVDGGVKVSLDHDAGSASDCAHRSSIA